MRVGIAEVSNQPDLALGPNVARISMLHQYAATTSLPLHTTTANQREWETIIEFLKEERACIKMLRQLLEMANDNTAKLHSLFEDSPVNSDIN